jgi:hypothetical protein
MTFSQAFSEFQTFMRSNRNQLAVAGMLMLLGYLIIFHDLILNLDTVIGSTGSTYQNIYAYFMHLMNFRELTPFSLEGSQYTWYENVMAANEINHLPAIIFGLLYVLTQNYAISFNLLALFYTILFQFGLFLLLRKYSGKFWLSLILSFGFLSSQAWGVSYTHHLHVIVLAGIPFFLFFAEQYFFNPGIPERYYKYHLLGITLSIAFIVFSSVHATAFASVVVAAWSIYHLRDIWHTLRYKSRKVLKACVAALIPLIPFLIYIVNMLRASRIYLSEATIIRTADTTPGLEYYEYIKPAVNVAGLSLGAQNNFVLKLAGYPDLFSNILFNLVLISFVPLIIYFGIKRRFPHWLFWITFFLFCYLIALGPFVKINGQSFQTLFLPHYAAYHLFYPIQIIRAAWRFNFIGYFGLTLGVGVGLSQLMNTFGERTIKHTKLKPFIEGGIAACLIIIFAISARFTFPPVTEAYQNEAELVTYFDRRLESEEDLDYFYIFPQTTDILVRDPYERATTLFVAQYNFDLGRQGINWVTGGGLGTEPNSFRIYDLLFSPEAAETGIQILYAKKVDVIQIENGNKEHTFNALEQYYTQTKTLSTSSIWERKPDQDIEEFVTDEITFSLASSRFAQLADSNFFIVNMNNFGTRTFVNPKRSELEDFALTITQNGDELSRKNLNLFVEPFITANSGYSFPIEMGKNNLNGSGDYNVELKRGDQVLYTKPVTFLDDDEFTQKVADAQAQELAVTSNTYQLTVPQFTHWATRIPADFQVESGVIDTTNDDLVYQYRVQFEHPLRPEVEPYFLPGQINAGVPGIYFPGDSVQYWAYQLTQFEFDNTVYMLQINVVDNPTYWEQLERDIQRLRSAPLS